MAEEKVAKLKEVMEYFEIKKASEFQREWKELTPEDKHEIQVLVAAEIS